MSQAVIYGVAGLALTQSEADFLRDADPWGFILFARNIGEADQVRALCADLRAAVGRDAPILIDQEGGRVARLRPPLVPARPAMDRFGELAKLDPHAAEEAAFLGARLIAEDCRGLGIDVDCAPVLDVRGPDTHDAIGDRALARDPQTVTRLGRAVADGLMAGGCLPVVKHTPGQGRAAADSHHELPRVTAPLSELEATDFPPFAALSDLPMAMTTHIVFEALDADRPCTQSPIVIGETIRGRLGFDGLLMTDDLSMKALGGGFRERAERSLAAGCDVILHCNGDAGEMHAVAEGARALDADGARRADAALALRPAAPNLAEKADREARFTSLLRPVTTA